MKKNRMDVLGKGKHLAVYLMAGDGGMKITEEIVRVLEREGVSLVELGIPFSDPLADGPVIMKASERALKNKTTAAGVFAAVKRIRKTVGIPIVVMTYYNIIYAYGIKKFIDDALAVGIDGAIIPDLPYDEEKDYYKYALKKNFNAVLLAAPSNTKERAVKIAEKSKGFMYYVLVKGVTGERKKNEADFGMLAAVKKSARVPVFAGFGISVPAQAAGVLEKTDGIIIGSAFVKLFEENCGKADAIPRRAAEFIRPFVRELKRSRGE
ncbi:MAG TPA: tryptophan synthase subunit alpha [Firmicutes bacterium]|nr:tryptophan synthase subunit alpha [Bacillota bacterium]